MFNGRYGNLSTVDAAQKSLQDIADNCTWDDLRKADNETIPVPERYDAIRLLRMIEGLQMVLSKNGVTQPVTWLPMLYKPQHETVWKPPKITTPDLKARSYATKDD